MAETDDEYIQRRMREHPFSKYNPWNKPEVFTRPPELEGALGGRGSHTIPTVPSAEPLFPGTSQNQIGRSKTVRGVVVVSGSAAATTYDVLTP